MNPAHHNAPDMAGVHPGWHQPAQRPGHQFLEPRFPFQPQLTEGGGAYPYPGSVSSPPPPSWPSHQYFPGHASQHWYAGGAMCGVRGRDQMPFPTEHPGLLNPNPVFAAWIAAGTPAPGPKGATAFAQHAPALGPWRAAVAPGVACRAGLPLAAGPALGAGTPPLMVHNAYPTMPDVTRPGMKGPDMARPHMAWPGMARQDVRRPEMLLSEMEDAWGRDEGWLAVPDETRAGGQDEDGTAEEGSEGGIPGGACEESFSRGGDPFANSLLDSEGEGRGRGPAASAGDACSKWAGPTRAVPRRAPQAGPSDSWAEPEFPGCGVRRRGGHEMGQFDAARGREWSEGNSEPLAASRKRMHSRKASSDSSLLEGGGGGKGAAMEGAYGGGGACEGRGDERSGDERGRRDVAEEEGRVSELYGSRSQSQLRVALARPEHLGNTGGNGGEGHGRGPSLKKPRLHSPLGPAQPSALSAQHQGSPQRPQEQQLLPQHQQQGFSEVPLRGTPKGGGGAAARHAVGVPEAHLYYAMGSYLAQACDKGRSRPLPCIFRSQGAKGFQ